MQGFFSVHIIFLSSFYSEFYLKDCNIINITLDLKRFLFTCKGYHGMGNETSWPYSKFSNRNSDNLDSSEEAGNKMAYKLQANTDSCDSVVYKKVI